MSLSISIRNDAIKVLDGIENHIKEKSLLEEREEILNKANDICLRNKFSKEANKVIDCEIELNKKIDKLHNKQNQEYLSTVKNILDEIYTKDGASNEC